MLEKDAVILSAKVQSGNQSLSQEQLSSPKLKPNKRKLKRRINLDPDAIKDPLENQYTQKFEAESPFSDSEPIQNSDDEYSELKNRKKLVKQSKSNDEVVIESNQVKKRVVGKRMKDNQFQSKNEVKAQNRLVGFVPNNELFADENIDEIENVIDDFDKLEITHNAGGKKLPTWMEKLNKNEDIPTVMKSVVDHKIASNPVKRKTGQTIKKVDSTQVKQQINDDEKPKMLQVSGQLVQVQASDAPSNHHRSQLFKELNQQKQRGKGTVGIQDLKKTFQVTELQSKRKHKPAASELAPDSSSDSEYLFEDFQPDLLHQKSCVTAANTEDQTASVGITSKGREDEADREVIRRPRKKVTARAKQRNAEKKQQRNKIKNQFMDEEAEVSGSDFEESDSQDLSDDDLADFVVHGADNQEIGELNEDMLARFILLRQKEDEMEIANIQKSLFGGQKGKRKRGPDYLDCFSPESTKKRIRHTTRSEMDDGDQLIDLDRLKRVNQIKIKVAEETEISENQLLQQADQHEILKLQRDVIKHGGEAKLKDKYTNLKERELEEEAEMARTLVSATKNKNGQKVMGKALVRKPTKSNTEEAKEVPQKKQESSMMMLVGSNEGQNPFNIKKLNNGPKLMFCFKKQTSY